MKRKREDDPGYVLWLAYVPLRNGYAGVYRELLSSIALLGNSPLHGAVRRELFLALEGMFSLEPVLHQDRALASPCVFGMEGDLSRSGVTLPEGGETLGSEGFRILYREMEGNEGRPRLILAAGGPSGLLYGVFRLLAMIRQGFPPERLACVDYPRLAWRMLNHWDNLDGTVERGYGGLSLWKWDDLPGTVDPRYRDYGRACASVGINGAVLNNVNAGAEILSDPYLDKVAVLSGILREYGMRTLLSVSFASPQRLGGLPTSDPLDASVRLWWRERIQALYERIPDFGGFLVKADSEGQSGPLAYGRTHAQGANMLASLLAPHGGVLVWRAFVYGQGEKDRVTAAYGHFLPQDGTFLSNAVLQVKNGPLDFQPREPVHPLFGAMERTNLFMEVQITQEYLGQGNHVVYLAPMWKEILGFDTERAEEPRQVGPILADRRRGDLTGMAGVANAGDDPDWCGSIMHPANWHAFGRLSWNYALESAEILGEWIALTFDLPEESREAVKELMLLSWPACVDYMAPLGLHHIMKEHHHYGPDPGFDGGPRPDWRSTYYHRADSRGLGFDRTRRGTNGTGQYAPPLAERLNALETCPENYLLWFHHVPWKYRLSSGRTLREELPFRYSRGVEAVERMLRLWDGLEGSVDHERFERVRNKLKIQLFDAGEWQDVCVPYFLSFGGSDDVESGSAGG